MKNYFIVIIGLCLIGACRRSKIVSGSYTNGNAIEYRFEKSPNYFEYFLRSEMGLLAYSKGKWIQKDDSLLLSGFTDKNIKHLEIKYNLSRENPINDILTKIYYSSDCNYNYIKTDILLNGIKLCEVVQDTIIQTTTVVNTIQVLSYMSYSGLFSNAPKNDTLSSSIISVEEGSSKHKIIYIRNMVSPEDFIRTEYSDTLIIKTDRILKNKKNKFKKW